jgi:hypothetical protein
MKVIGLSVICETHNVLVGRMEWSEVVSLFDSRKLLINSEVKLEDPSIEACVTPPLKDTASI